MAIRNLTATAIAELDAILDGAHTYGPDAAETELVRFTALFDAIARGRGLGHWRTDIGFPAFIRFRRLRPLPFTVIDDDRTNIVLRTVRGGGVHEGTVLDDLDRA